MNEDAPLIKGVGGLNDVDVKYNYIPYDTKLKNLAKKLRRNTTRPEKIIWDECLKKCQTGYKFLRQKPLDRFIVDFYCPELMLAVEIDGTSHDYRLIEDNIRTEILNNLGIKVVRYSNEVVLGDLPKIKAALKREISDRATKTL